jgi:hypothetical protein
VIEIPNPDHPKNIKLKNNIINLADAKEQFRRMFKVNPKHQNNQKTRLNQEKATHKQAETKT